MTWVRYWTLVQYLCGKGWWASFSYSIKCNTFVLILFKFKKSACCFASERNSSKQQGFLLTLSYLSYLSLQLVFTNGSYICSVSKSARSSKDILLIDLSSLSANCSLKLPGTSSFAFGPSPPTLFFFISIIFVVSLKGGGFKPSLWTGDLPEVISNNNPLKVLSFKGISFEFISLSVNSPELIIFGSSPICCNH